MRVAVLFCACTFVLAIPAPGRSATPAATPRCVQILSITDLHGALDAQTLAPKSGATKAIRAGGVEILSGYVDIVRKHFGEKRVVLLDAGDLYQGTLASNLSQGAAVIDAYNALGVTAAAVGNHEFDFGAGKTGGTDLLAVFHQRATQAKFPFLAVNVRDKHTGATPSFIRQSILYDAGGITLGIIGAATPDTPRVTLAANVASLDFPEPDTAIVAEAKSLRAQGAELIVLLAHLGSLCTSTQDPNDLKSCQPEREGFIPLLKRLPPGVVDVAVGGHTHHLMAHWVANTAAIQAGARAEYLAHVSACLDSAGKFDNKATHFEQPLHLVEAPAIFMGDAVVTNPAVTHALAPYRKEVAVVGARIVAALPQPLKRSQALGVMVANAMRQAVHADVAVQNRGGVRIDLPAGPLTYAQVFSTLPFDNRIVTLTLTGTQLIAAVQHLVDREGVLLPYVGGMTATLTPKRTVVLRLPGGDAVNPTARYTVATNDFLVDGGEGLDTVLRAVAPADKHGSELTVRDAFERYIAALYPPTAANVPLRKARL